MVLIWRVSLVAGTVQMTRVATAGGALGEEFATDEAGRGRP